MTIQELKSSKRVRDRWLAVLEDGSILRLGKNQIEDFALYGGRELSDVEADRLIQAVQTENFRAYALQTLLNGPKSRNMLLELLAKKDGPPEQAGEIADWLEEFGYLNDGAYAAELAQSCARRGYGPKKIRDEFYRRGVPRELWDQALEDLEDPAEQLDAFLSKKLAGVEHPDRKELQRASAALARRGYQWTDISAALRRYGAEIEED